MTITRNVTFSFSFLKAAVQLAQSEMAIHFMVFQVTRLIDACGAYVIRWIYNLRTNPKFLENWEIFITRIFSGLLMRMRDFHFSRLTDVFAMKCPFIVLFCNDFRCRVQHWTRIKQEIIYITSWLYYLFVQSNTSTIYLSYRQRSETTCFRFAPVMFVPSQYASYHLTLFFFSFVILRL